MAVGIMMAMTSTAGVAMAGPLDVPLPALDREPGFTLKALAGRVAVIHVLREPGATQSVAFVKDILARRDKRAGVVHVFVRGGSEAEVKQWWSGFDGAGAVVVRDEAGALAKEFALEGLGAASIGLDQDGKEIFRIAGAAPSDHPKVDALFARLDATSKAPSIGEYNLPKGSNLAVQGYDVVSYFEGAPAKGKKELTSVYQGVAYQFTTAEHRRKFAEKPTFYLPTYGGWCASAIGAKAEKVSIDPTNYKVKDGRLHLFYKGTWGDALKDWNKHESEWEPAADANWKKIAGEAGGRPR